MLVIFIVSWWLFTSHLLVGLVRQMEMENIYKFAIRNHILWSNLTCRCLVSVAYKSWVQAWSHVRNHPFGNLVDLIKPFPNNLDWLYVFALPFHSIISQKIFICSTFFNSREYSRLIRAKELCYHLILMRGLWLK